MAVLLPGAGCLPARPLLHSARAVPAHHGWTGDPVGSGQVLKDATAAMSRFVQDL